MPEGVQGWTCQACGGANPVGTRFCGHCGAPAAPPDVPEREAAGARDADASGEVDGGREADVAEALRSFVSRQVADRLVEAGGRISDERRLVTSLFADLSGFTPLADRLDPEQLLDVIDPLIRGLANVVGRYEGYVDKYAGDALLAFFGAPVSHEDDAERALRVALEMHEELERLRQGLPGDVGDLTLHVGVNSGHAIARILGSEVRLDYSVLGDAVILAQRLESAAPAGETYVGESTYALARSRFEFEPVGPLTLKGKADPIRAYRLLGERRLPRGGPREAARVVGRDRELSIVSGSLDRLRDGVGGIVVVRGEPGVGKTALTDASRDRAVRAGFRWYEARCASYGSSLPYRPIAELIRRANGIGRDERPAPAVKLLTSAFERLGVPDAVPFFARLLGLPVEEQADVLHLEPEAFRRGLHAAFADVIRAAGSRGPVVIAIEDAHWADASTLQLLAESAHLCAEGPVMLYLTARTEIDLTPILAPVPGDGAAIVDLGPLAADAVGAVVAHILDAPPTTRLLDAVMDRTGGNPFFAEEMVRTLRDSGRLERGDAGWDVPSGWTPDEVPPTIEEVLAARIDRLSPDARATLVEASVIGRRVLPELLRAIVADVDRLPAAVDELVRTGFLDVVHDKGDELLLFHHALIVDVAYSRLLRRRRREVHVRVADAAERLYGAGDDAVELLARHLYLGAAGARAIAMLRRAAVRARELYANDEAILHLSRAVEVARAEPDATADLHEILLELAAVHELQGGYAEALAIYREVRDATNDVRAWRGEASIQRARGQHDEALATIDTAFAAVGAEADVRALWLERGWTLGISGRFAEGIDALEQGLRIDPGAGGTVVGHLLVQLAYDLGVEGKHAEALERAERAKSVFERAGDVPGEAKAVRLIGAALSDLGRHDEASVVIERALALAERVGSVVEIASCLIDLGFVYGERGAFDEAVRCDLRAVEEFERIGHGQGTANAYANLATHLDGLGERDRALEYCDRAMRLASEIGFVPIYADAMQTKASIRFEQADFGEAADCAEKAADLYVEMGAPIWAADALDIASRAWESAGDPVRARSFSERAAELRESATVS